MNAVVPPTPVPANQLAPALIPAQVPPTHYAPAALAPALTAPAQPGKAKGSPAPAAPERIRPVRERSRPRRTAVFVREFLHDPLTTASLVPSSAALAAAMIPAGRNWPVVVELGPGTGSFSRALAGQQRPPVRHLGIEVNPTMSDLLSKDFPEMQVVTAAAAELTAVLASEHLLGRVDLIVSGLPWQAFAGPVGAGLIPAIAGALRPDGAFTQFTYSWTRWTPPGRRQHANLRASFGRVQVKGPVWANVPPATVYTCSEPRRGS